MPQHNFVIGINAAGERFVKKLPDSTQFNNYNYNTLGVFVQDDWKIAKQVTVQTGLRWDNHAAYGNFILPRLSLLYKISNRFTSRLGGGLGYKAPSEFANDIDERQYRFIVQNNALKAEQSSGINWDINYKNFTGDWHVTVNQMFYITQIKNPVVQQNLTGNVINFYNATQPVKSKGFETYVAATLDELEIYIGYTYTVAKQLYDAAHPNVSLSAKNKLATVISFEVTDALRLGWETAYTGKQYLDNGSTTSGYVFAAAMVRYNIKHISFVLNCENLFDYRQTKKESIFTGPITNPVFKQIWAPLDGRVINLSAKISW
jgi:iron complex outermembrane receptor protein/outer membrane receptor for ferrienterochelin and colicins